MPVLTLVMTDVEGSSRLWEQHGSAAAELLARHHEIVWAAIAEHGGRRPPDQGEGDAVFAAFESPSAALAAVLRFQRRLHAEPWPFGVRIRDRVAVHVGDVVERGRNLAGLAVARTARLRDLGAGGQVLLSAEAAAALRGSLPEPATITDLGEHRLRGLDGVERVFELTTEDLTARFPAPVAGRLGGEAGLPVALEPDAALRELLELVAVDRLPDAAALIESLRAALGRTPAASA